MKDKNQNHMIVTIEADKAFDKIHHLFMEKKKKTLNREILKGTNLNMKKPKCNKPKANIILDHKGLKAFRLRS